MRCSSSSTEMLDWKRDAARLASADPMPSAPTDLWSFYATGGFRRRNEALAGELAVLANESKASLRRVFEFASDGSFMTVLALQRPELRSTLTHWVTSDIGTNALRYSTWQFECGAKCIEHPHRPLVVPSDWKATRGTYLLNDNHTRVDVEAVDVGRLHRHIRMDAFDAFVTISMEHMLLDLQLLRSIPCGKIVVFSVPNFGRPAHAKTLARTCRNASRYVSACDQHWHTFQNEGEIRARYGGLLEIRRVLTVPHMGRWKKFIVSGKRYRLCEQYGRAMQARSNTF